MLLRIERSMLKVILFLNILSKLPQGMKDAVARQSQKCIDLLNENCIVKSNISAFNSG